ncbi:hypothetical protein ACFX13_032439 [Malus domestica]
MGRAKQTASKSSGNKIPQKLLTVQTIMKKTATTRGAPRADPSCSQMPPPPPPKANAQVPKLEVDGKQVFINVSGLKDHKYAESVTRGLPSPEILSMLMNSTHANLILEAFQHATSAASLIATTTVEEYSDDYQNFEERAQGFI